jgi:hypothetical protein
MSSDLGRCQIGAIAGAREEQEAFNRQHPDLQCSEKAIGVCKGCGKPACEKHLNACRADVYYVKHKGWFTQAEIDAMKAAGTL